MNRASTYLFSLFLSVILVFSILGAAFCAVVNFTVTPENTVELTHENAIDQKVYDYLDNLYKDRYYTSGIPAGIYMDAIDNNWLKEIIEADIKDGFEVLNEHTALEREFKNDELEKNIRNFFSNYADSVGAEKDDIYNRKVDKAVSNAYSIIESACDVYKIKTLQQHGVITKLAKVYSRCSLMTTLLVSAILVICLLLMFVNRKDTTYVLYWAGVSSIIAGIIGAAPCGYLLLTKFYDSFSIKQPQIYTAYTSAMYSFTYAVTAIMIALIITGIAVMTLYSVVWRFKVQTKELEAIHNNKLNDK
ncbi:MAG: hypothetical protein J5501_00820 [Ruminococcus sp.]|nr:hypothetical protein [Ruminococcus sp.]